MLINDEILDVTELHPSHLPMRLEPGKLYLWESTQSGPLNGGVYDINGNEFAGVQVMQTYNPVCFFMTRVCVSVCFVFVFISFRLAMCG